MTRSAALPKTAPAPQPTWAAAPSGGMAAKIFVGLAFVLGMLAVLSLLRGLQEAQLAADQSITTAADLKVAQIDRCLRNPAGTVTGMAPVPAAIQNQIQSILAVPTGPWQSATFKLVPALAGEPDRVVEARDDAGAPVRAALRPIPGTPWTLMATISRDEVHAPIRRSVGLTGIAFAAFFAAGLAWLRSLCLGQAQLTLLENEERLHLSQRIARVGTWDWDVVLDRVVCSDELCRIWKVAPEDAPANYRAVLERVHLGDRSSLALAIARGLPSAARIEDEHQICAPAEAPGFVRTVGQIYRDLDGRPIRVVATVLDITEQKTARLALIESEERLRAIVDNMGEGFLRVGPGGKIEVVNPAALALLGYDTAGALIGKDLRWDIYVDPALEERHRAQLLYDGRKCNQRAWWRRCDGSRLLVEGNVRVLRDGDGAPEGFEGIFRDITAQEEYQEALRRSQADLTRAQQLAQVGRWHWDIVKQEMHWEPEVFALYGLDPATFRPSRENYLAMIHPDDRQLVSTRWNRAEAGVTISRDHRIITPAGAFKYFHLEGVLERDDAGMPARIVGITQDVTERVREREELRALMAALPDTIIQTDAGGIVLDVHAPSGRALSVAAATMLGRPLEASLPLEVWRVLYPVLARAGASDQVQTTECWIDAAQGLRQCLEVRVASVRDGGFVAIARDVTAGKDANLLLRPPHRPMASPEQPLAGLIVLVVEDNETNRVVAQQLLESAGAIVETACAGDEAVERFAARGELFDAVLMDIAMPRMDGYQATQAIRRDGNGANVPIIAATAHVFTSEVKQCLAAGMDDHVGKPIDPEKLITTLLRWTRPASRKPPLPG